jgi:hypothetical protein
MVEIDSGVLSMSLIGCLDNASKYWHSLHMFVCQVVCELFCKGVLGCHLKAKVVALWLWLYLHLGAVNSFQNLWFEDGRWSASPFENLTVLISFCPNYRGVCNVYIEPGLSFELGPQGSWILKKCGRIKIARFKNEKNRAQTCTWKIFNFLKVSNLGLEVLLKQKSGTTLLDTTNVWAKL